jgi:hypothetical protein
VDDRVQVDQDAMATALEQAAEAVVALGTAEHLQALDDILADSFTPQALRIAIARLRGARRTPTPTATGDGGTPSGPGAPPPTTVPPGLPLRLSPDQISAAFSQFRPGLLSCLDGAPSRPSQVRIQFRYDNEGHVSHVVVAPTSFQACMQVLVEQVPLPPSLVAREIGTYLLDAR